MIDASDVVVFKRPPDSANQLVVGVDLAKAWFKGLMAAQNYTPSTRLKQIIHGKDIMYNSGIIGGSRSNVLHFLSDFRNRSLAHPYAYDMVNVNEYFVNTNKNLTLGYPHGPVHLPFWAVVPGCSKNETCRHDFLRKTMGYYWFGHKIHHKWTSLLRNEHFCRINDNKEEAHRGENT